MNHMIHDWDESKAISIVTDCARAMSANGKILLVECMVKGPDTPDFGEVLDLFMLLMPGE